MNKMFQFMEKYFMPVAGRLAAQNHLGALRDGIALTMPMIIIGSVFLILSNLPFPHYSDWLAHTFGAKFATYLGYPVNATFNMMGLIAAFGISYRLAEAYEIDGLTAGIISVCAFLLAAPFGLLTAAVQGGTDGIPVALMGSKGLFVAMIIGLLGTEIYRFFVQKNIIIKMPDGVPPAVSKSFIALIPGFVIIVLVWILRLWVENSHFGSIFNVVGDLLGKPLGALGTSLPGTLITILVVQLLWSCGLHGMNIVSGVMGPIWLGAMGDNMAAYKTHQPLPHIVTQQFFDNFVNLGGSGATLMLVLLFLMGKSAQNKSLGRLAIGAGIFEINEPMIFGAPIVMNPLLIIPFIFTPIINAALVYFGMDLGLVAKPSGVAVPWTTPPIISGFLATGGHISGSIIQVIELAIDFFVYLPFFIMFDKMKKKEEVELEEMSKKAI
jgi:cellobiose PTS system EIIC component